MILSPQSTDRILLLAPHPDDETLAVGGLLRRAVQAGAQVRVLYITDGENNPWAQRASERRWAIGPGDRLRWGVRRRAEALAALATLGVPQASAEFLGFPDQHLTDRLLAGDLGLVNRLVQELERFHPTLFVLPSTQDAHPDHNTLAVEAAFALDQAHPSVPSPRVFSYLVHSPRSRLALAPAPVRVPLSAEDLAVKRRAIECHATQLKLHRRLFRFLTAEETLWPDDEALPPASEHPIQASAIRQENLLVDVTQGQEFALGRAHCFLVGGRGTEERHALVIPLPDRPGSIEPHLLAPGRELFRATRTPEGRLRLELSLSSLTPAPARVFAKIERPAERRLGFFDRAGWRALIAPAKASRPPADARGVAASEGQAGTHR